VAVVMRERTIYAKTTVYMNTKRNVSDPNPNLGINPNTDSLFLQHMESLAICSIGFR